MGKIGKEITAASRLLPPEPVSLFRVSGTAGAAATTSDWQSSRVLIAAHTREKVSKAANIKGHAARRRGEKQEDDDVVRAIKGRKCESIRQTGREMVKQKEEAVATARVSRNQRTEAHEITSDSCRHDS